MSEVDAGGVDDDADVPAVASFVLTTCSSTRMRLFVLFIITGMTFMGAANSGITAPWAIFLSIRSTNGAKSAVVAKVPSTKPPRISTWGNCFSAARSFLTEEIVFSLSV